MRAVDEKTRGYRRKRAAYDHWRRTAEDKGRPSQFTTAAQLLDDVRGEGKGRWMKKGSPNDLAGRFHRSICGLDPAFRAQHPCSTRCANGMVRRRRERADAAQISAEAMVELLSPGNLAVLAAICARKPGSMRERATLTGRKEASLSRTLKRFAQAGIVGFQDGPHRTRVPALIARRMHLDIELAGRRRAVAVDGSR